MIDSSEAEETRDTHTTHDTQESASAKPAQAEANPAEPADVVPSLSALITAIRGAVIRDASVEARAAGAAACRSILTVLEAKPGHPLRAAMPAAVPTATPSASPLAHFLSQPGLLSRLAAMSREQLLDLLRQVTGAMPANPQTPTTGAPRFHLIQIPQTGRAGGR